jgi:hypothetical protein
LISHFFGYVERQHFLYELSIRNPSESEVFVANSGATGELERMEAIWNFTGGGKRSHFFPFPAKIGPKDVLSYPPVDEVVLAPGYAHLWVRIWTVGKHLEVVIKDASGETLPRPEHYEEVVEKGKHLVGWTFHSDIQGFIAKSRGETNQWILISIAIVALVVNAVFSVLNWLKR